MFSFKKYDGSVAVNNLLQGKFVECNVPMSDTVVDNDIKGSYAIIVNVKRANSFITTLCFNRGETMHWQPNGSMICNLNATNGTFKLKLAQTDDITLWSIVNYTIIK